MVHAGAMSLRQWLRSSSSGDSTPSFLHQGGYGTRLKYACEFGNKTAVQKYSAELGFTISEGTVRNFKRTYLERLKSTPDPDAITSLPHTTGKTPADRAL